MKHHPRHVLVLLATGVVLAACGGSGNDPIPTTPDPGPTGSSGAPPASTGTAPVTKPPITTGPIDLRADTNRDGVISFDDVASGGDDIGEDVWDAKHGAVFLANIDDDEEKCPSSGDDVDLPKCNDAADEVVNGPDDALDLARLQTKPWADAPDGATGTITTTASNRVRLFKVSGTTFTVLAADAKLTAAELRAGVELAIEAKDIVRDTAVWDGFVDVTFSVDGAAGTSGTAPTETTDKVRMRVAPLLTSHHLSETVGTYVTQLNSAGSQATRADLATAATAAGVPAPKGILVQDQWTQDFFEPAFMTMPGPNGTQHAMRVNLRSANESNPGSSNNPLRLAGKVVFTQLRGKDVAGVQQFDAARNGQFDTLNSFGNFETIPPYTNGGESFPLGRVLRGNIASYHPDNSFLKMIESQKVQQPLYIDTSWLVVGHVDETLSFIRTTSSPRGWVMLVNDPTLAKTMLEQQSTAGNGAVPMFVGKSWSGSQTAQITIDQVLADTDVMTASAEAATQIDGQLATIKAATGLTDAEIIRIPYLHMPYSQGSIAFQPGMVNGLYIAPGHFVAPDPHGPDIAGVDPFKAIMEQRLAPFGVTVHWAEDWDLYHRNLGEVHCGTNSTRQIPDSKWWESGR
jgi:protein-arginine deiminase